MSFGRKLLFDNSSILNNRIAKSFNAEDIIGQKVSVLVNLAPRKLRGVESEGMILMTETPDGKLAFIEPEKDSVTNGEQVSLKNQFLILFCQQVILLSSSKEDI